MCPFKYGKHVAEVEYTTLLSHRFCILINLKASKELLGHIEKLCTLRDYLLELKSHSVRIEVYLSPELNRYVPETLDLPIASLQEKDDDFDSQLVEVATAIDADVVVLPQLSESLKQEEESMRTFTTRIEDALLKAEAFVRGHDIPWACNAPAWNMPWTAFYTMCDHYGKEAWSTYSATISDKALNESASEVLRSLLLNKVPFISYTRDKLLFYRLQKMYAKRNGFSKQDYKFEAGYYLTCYYLLIWGGIDQLSIVLNDKLQLGFKGINISITKKEFRNKVISVSKEVGKILSEENLINWFEILRQVRHFVAHRGNIILSDLLEEPELDLSEEEIEAKTKKHPYYLRTIINLEPEALRNSYWELLKEQVKVSMHKKISDEAMIFDYNGKRCVLFPWKNVELDFNFFRDLVSNLTVEIRNSPRTENPI